MKVQQTSSVESLIATLRRASGLLDSAHQQLRTEVIETCNCLENPTCRVAVFGPFNYGKSTLLNALLGEKTLPMDLVPTTGAAITVKYGSESKARVFRADSSSQETSIEEINIDDLQRYAVLDEQRRMKADIAAVEVFCPHPLLALGIELIDLPGTDDAIAQNELVQQQLLSADVVIQVLDGRKLMTLAEREHLRDWLLDRGIETVIFVVNFLNLVEEDDRQQVLLRLRFIAESFRSALPNGVSNQYRVDALPALRARLQGDSSAATASGLSALESALQTVGQQFKAGRPLSVVPSRLITVRNSVVQALQKQIEQIESNQSVSQPCQKDSQKTAIKQKAQRLIQEGFEKDVSTLRQWLAVQNLQDHYRLGLANALEDNSAPAWLIANIKPAWMIRSKAVVDWVHQASEFFDYPCPPDMQVQFAEVPEKSVLKRAEDEAKESDGIAPVAIATGLGWMLGGPLGAAILGGASYLIDSNGREEKEASATQPLDYEAYADTYLARFSAEALAVSYQYEREVKQIIQTKIDRPSHSSSIEQHAKLGLLHSVVRELGSAML